MTLGDAVKNLGHVLKRAATPFAPHSPFESLFRKRGGGKCGVRGGMIGSDRERWRKHEEARRKRLEIEQRIQKKWPGHQIDWAYVNGPLMA